jgi:hypothetical protein
MPTTTERPRVDVGGLGGAVFQQAAEALANTIVHAMESSDEQSFPLNEKQKSQLVEAALLFSSSLEAHMTRAIVDDLERAGVNAWGLPNELETLLRPKSGR